jgi:hypothetical protein
MIIIPSLMQDQAMVKPLVLDLIGQVSQCFKRLGL